MGDSRIVSQRDDFNEIIVITAFKQWLTKIPESHAKVLETIHDGYSQTETARILGIHQSAVSRLVKKYHQPILELLYG